MKRKTKQNRVRSSITRRLNWDFFWRMLWSFLATDLFLLVMFWGGLTLRAEARLGELAQGLLEIGGAPPAGTGYFLAETVPETGLELTGLLPDQWLPETTRAGRRWLQVSDAVAPAWGLLRLESAGERTCYTLSLPTPQGELLLSADLEDAALLAAFSLRVLLTCQCVALVLGLGRNRVVIQSALRPIEEFAQTASSLNEAATASGDVARLADTLDQINAAHLDARLPEGEVQEELRTLTSAINAMLDRIDDSCRAQLRFVSDASHELRTPIAVIQGYASLLDRWGKDDPETRQEAIDAIRQEADSMKELVEQLLFLARGDNDSMSIQMEQLDLSALAGEVFRESEMIDKAHAFQAELEEEAWVVADDGLTKQALRVLVDNAIKYTPAGGKIALSVRTADGHALLSVQDEGQGIAPQDLPHIFERFYRADQSRARQTGGTGLGLAIAKWIVERHSGWIEVTSREGIGTRMTMVLPLAPLS